MYCSLTKNYLMFVYFSDQNLKLLIILQFCHNYILNNTKCNFKYFCFTCKLIVNISFTERTVTDPHLPIYKVNHVRTFNDCHV